MKAIVLSSGGCDSSVCVGLAVDRFGSENVTTVSVVYGQRHIIELECADKIAEHYGLNHKILNLSQIYEDSNSALLSHSTKDVPEGTYAEQLEGITTGAQTVIPFRNGLMLSAVAALAQSIYPDEEVHIYLGAHADDAAGNAYADCSEEFTSTMAHAIDVGTYNLVKVEAPLVTLNKTEVVGLGLNLNVPFNLTTSCYNGRACACGRCGTCLDRIAAFRANGVVDPIDYEVDVDWSDCKKIDYISNAE